MKTQFTGITQIAAAVSLALGSSLAIAQQQSDERIEQGFGQEQRTEQQPNSDARAQPSAEQVRTDSASGHDASFASVADEQPELSKFVEAVNAAGLTESLTDGSEYTLFAPTNDALDSEDIDSLLEQDNRQELVALLRAHIVADDVDRELAGQIGKAQTIDGGTVDISVEGEKLMIGDAEAMEAEVMVGNLRVYAVDSVLPSNPPAQSARNERDSVSDGAFGNQSEGIEVPDPEVRPQ